MYALKTQLDDFLVDEVLSRDILVQEATAYHVYLLKKRNYTTERAVRAIARAVGKPRKAISYAGTKDKQATTTQYIVLKGVNKERVASLDLKDIEVTFVGYAAGHLRLGDLSGNRFRIRVRNAPGTPETKETFFVPNYFDEQRFSTQNVAIGLAMLRKEFSKATEIICAHDKDFSEELRAHLEKNKNDHIGALRLLPRKTLLFYIHAVQSKIFNDMLAAQLEGHRISYSQGEFVFPKQLLEDVEPMNLPLPGYDTEIDLSKYGIEPRNFLITSMPELCLQGNMRAAYFQVKECKITKDTDVIECSFLLPKGCYATIVIRQLFAMLEAE